MSVPRSKLRSAWLWILILPAVGLVFPAFYARATPALFGFPFFYWYQIAWILITALITAVAYFISKSE